MVTTPTLQPHGPCHLLIQLYPLHLVFLVHWQQFSLSSQPTEKSGNRALQDAGATLTNLFLTVMVKSVSSEISQG